MLKNSNNKRFGTWRSWSAQAPLSSALELFRGMSRSEIGRLGKYFTTINVACARDLGRRGDPCTYFGVVVSGKVAMSVDDSPVGILEPGCFFGAVALLDEAGHHLRRGTATALEDSRIAVATRREFSELLHESATVARRVHAVVQRRRSFIESISAPASSVDPMRVNRPTWAVHVPAGM